MAKNLDSELRIQLAAIDDAVEIAQISKDEIEFGLPWRWTPPRIARAIGDATTNVVVARSAGALVGFGIMHYAEDAAHLLLLAVRSSHHRAGVGGALLVWLEEVARAAGIATLRVEARQDNAAARAFYQRHGYRELARVPGMYCGIEDGIRFAKTLGDSAG